MREREREVKREKLGFGVATRYATLSRVRALLVLWGALAWPRCALLVGGNRSIEEDWAALIIWIDLWRQGAAQCREGVGFRGARGCEWRAIAAGARLGDDGAAGIDGVC